MKSEIRRRRIISALETGFGSEAAPIPDPAQDLVTYYGDDLVLFFDPANLNTMFKEQATTTVPITHPSADADTLGMIYDRGYHGFFATAQSDATRPVLGSDATRNSFVTFDSASSQRLTFPNTAKYLKPIHDAGSNAYCFMFWVKVNAADGVLAVIADNVTNATANAGAFLRRTTTNKLQYKVTYASAGNSKIDITTTASLTASMGWTPVLIYSEGNGASKLHIQIGNAAEELATVGAVGTTADAFSNLFLACSPGPTAFSLISLGHFLMLNRIPTAQEWTDFKAFNPDRNTNNWVVNTVKYNFNNSLRGWADTGKTTPITNGVAIRAWEPEDATIFGPLNRDITTASAGVSPIWTTNLQNGKAGLVFDGTDDECAFTSALFRELGGAWISVIVVKNTRPELGSHVLSSGNATPYQVVTGSTYPSGVLGVGETYFTTHPSGGGSSGPTPLKNKVEATNVLVSRRNGGVSWSSWTGLKVETTDADNGQFAPNSIGSPSIAGWRLVGNLFKIEAYSGMKTTAQIEAMIDAENTSYNI